MRRQAAFTFAGLILVLSCVIFSGCYVSKDIMLRNPRYLELGDSALYAEDNRELMRSPDGLFSLPPGHEENLLPPRPGSVWLLSDSHPNRLKTIYFDSTREVNPSAYAVVGDKMHIMLARDYQYGSFQVDLARIDSVWAVEADFGRGETYAKVSVLGAMIGMIIILCTTVD